MENRDILFSWLAVKNDFNSDGSINVMGPTVNLHAYHWFYKQHYLLFTPDYYREAKKMQNYIQTKFQLNKINIIKMDIANVYDDLQAIRSKIEKLIMDYSGRSMDILISTGTGLMKIAWYLVHSSLNLNTRLVQILSQQDSKDGLYPELFEIQIDKSSTPVSAIIRENNLSKSYKKSPLITSSLQNVYDRAFKIAQADNVSAIIIGNTGTGKEMLANYIHSNSARKRKPFFKINCSAFNDQLLESRLFGYKKGSFTGAYNDFKGVFEQADGGIVFLDEIGDISPYLQQLLLRFLQEKEIQPIGGNTKKVDVRVIAATNKNIQNMINENKFRLDLFYRLGIILYLPDFNNYTVNEKVEWIDFINENKSVEFKKSRKLDIGQDLINFFCSYAFPGNIRELMNIFDNLYVFEEKKATTKELPYYIEKTKTYKSNKLADVEKEHILKILKKNNGNKTKTAAELDIAVNTLKAKIKDLQID